MPEISRFFGTVITMNYDDHHPPHFHVRYAEQNAIVAIHPPGLLAGDLSPRLLAMVTEWAALHEADLLENWRLARHNLPLRRIAPLV
jgi:hypothetical protein